MASIDRRLVCYDLSEDSSNSDSEESSMNIITIIDNNSTIDADVRSIVNRLIDELCGDNNRINDSYRYTKIQPTPSSLLMMYRDPNEIIVSDVSESTDDDDDEDDDDSGSSIRIATTIDDDSDVEFARYDICNYMYHYCFVV